MSEIVSLIGLYKKEIDQLKADLEKEKALKQTYLACYKTKHGDVKGKLFKYEELRQALQEIKEIAEKGCIGGYGCSELDQILQKCEVIEE